MRVIVYGVGAVGGVVAARLVQSGVEVVGIARGAHADEIERNGLVVESADERAAVRLPVVRAPAELDRRDDDVVVVAVKSNDTIDALDALRRSYPPATPVVCAQNGVENERAALRRFERVYGMCVMCPTGHLAPGIVQAYSTPVSGILDVGRYPSGVDATSEAVAALLSDATFVSVSRPDIMRWKYAKLLLNLGNAVEAACGSEARSSELARRARQEGEACLVAAGIDFASREEDTARRGTLLRLRPIGGAVRAGGSTWQSLERGTGAVETDYLNGEIVLLGRQLGIPVPVNELLQRVAAELAASRARPGTLDPDELLARVAT